MSIDPVVHLSHLRRETGLFAEALRRGPLDAPIAACPGWDMQTLGRHLATVHAWAETAARTGEPTRFIDVELPADGDIAGWYQGYADRLIGTLSTLDPDAPTWHIFPVERVNRVWPRRQAHETMVHRWDAERAGGSTTPFDPTVASDGIDEYFEVMLPRLMKREGGVLPAASLHVHCTDTAGEWLIRAGDGALTVVREHAKGDAALRGRAEDLLLRLWGREVAEGGVEIVGDPDAATAWLTLGGL